MANDLYNDDVVIDTTDDLDNTTNSSSNISDDSSHTTPPSVTPPTVNPINVSDDTNRIVDGWIRDTTATGGTAGETYNDTPPTEPPSSTPPVYKTVTRTIQEIISNYDQTYLQQLAEQGGKFYVYYTDGTRDEVEYTEIVDPHVAQIQTLVVEVDEITKANNQHFWYDDNGAHVTDETRDSWEENAAYNFSDLSDSNNHNNLLMNSYGLVIRRALKNLAAFSKSAVTFYDGEDNNVENVVASFGKNGARIGALNTAGISISSNHVMGYDKYGDKHFEISMEKFDTNIGIAQSKFFSFNNATTAVFPLDDHEYMDWSSDYLGESALPFWPSKYEDAFITFFVHDSKFDIMPIFEFYYGVPTDGWVEWTCGLYRYDGQNKLEVTFNEDITKASLVIFRPATFPMFAFGSGTANYAFAFAEGHDTTASSTAAHAEGEDTIASGAGSHAEGDTTIASGPSSHAEGFHTKASGFHSHAEGYYTWATGESSHSEGSNSRATGIYSHAQNRYTTAAGDCQTAIGKYNIEDTNNAYAFIIGNGTAHNARSNAFTVDWNGNIDFSGKISVSKLSWAGTTDNLVATATDNNQEWSIDLSPGSYTGTYWQVWSTAKNTILRCNSDDGLVTIPHGLYTSSIKNRRTSVTRGTTPSSDVWFGGIEYTDSNDARIGIVEMGKLASGYTGIWMRVSDNTSQAQGGFGVTHSTGNTATYAMTFNADSGWLEVPSSLRVAGHTTYNGSGIEFYPPANNSGYGGIIDFHFNQSTADYTSRIWENAQNRLTMESNSLYLRSIGASAVYTIQNKGVNAAASNNGISATQYPGFTFNDASDRILSRMECVLKTDGSKEAFWYVRQYNTSGTNTAQKGIHIKIPWGQTAATYQVDDPANFRSAIGAQASGNYAPHGWTQKASNTNDNAMTYSLSGCTEVMFAAMAGTTYLGSVILPVSLLHASTYREVYLSGGRTSTGGRAFALKATTTRSTVAARIQDTGAVACTWWVFAR